MARTAVLGLPRIGPNRELKFALEAFWAGSTGAEELEATARELRAANWQRAHAAGIDVIPSGDFSLYDHVLDTAWALGAVDRDAGYFALARGTATRKPLELTKWLDTNYHYLVPELSRRPPVRARRLALDGAAARGRGARDRDPPGRARARSASCSCPRARGASLEELVPVYAQLLRELAERPARPRSSSTSRASRSDRTARELDAFADAFTALRARRSSICLATYFAPADRASSRCPPPSIHVDLVRAPEQLPAALETAGRLSLGVLDGRNVWAADLDLALDRIDAAVAALGSDRVTIAPSCSLLHVPYEAAREDLEIRPWLAFAAEKLDELAVLKAALDGDRDALLEPAREVRARAPGGALDPAGAPAHARRLRARRAV